MRKDCITFKIYNLRWCLGVVVNLIPFTQPIFKHKQSNIMANEAAGNSGVFGDLFKAVGDLAQQATDMAGSAIKTATDTVQPVSNAAVQLCTTTINSATQIVESVTKSVTTALTPKQ